MSIACYDGRLILEADEQRAEIPIEVDLSLRVPFQCFFDAEDTCIALDNIGIYRDQYVTSSKGLFSVGHHSIARVPLSSFFILNDRGQDLRDSRSYGCIPRDAIEGMPVFSIWPIEF